MNKLKLIKPLFIVAALYDGILGILFLSMPVQIFNLIQVRQPDHIGYIQFSALLLIIFALMFFKIAKDPLVNKDLITYGILLKFSYCSIVFYYWFKQTIPFIWVLFAYFDLGFLVTFILSKKELK